MKTSKKEAKDAAGAAGAAAADPKDAAGKDAGKGGKDKDAGKAVAKPSPYQVIAGWLHLTHILFSFCFSPFQSTPCRWLAFHDKCKYFMIFSTSQRPCWILIMRKVNFFVWLSSYCDYKNVHCIVIIMFI